MAAEEEVELRDLVAHTLETKGVLGKIRAQLRASVFLALEEQESQELKPHPLVSSRFQQYLKTKDGKLATALVREFLSYFELDYTCSVFDPETNALETYPGRDKLASDLGLNLPSSDGPLISQLLHRPTAAGSAEALTSNVNSTTPPVSITSLSTATVPTTATSLIACETTFAPATLSQPDTVTAIPSSDAAPDGNRQPFSTHFSSTVTTTTTINSTATGTTTATEAVPHRENLQKSQNDLSHPANSLMDALLSSRREGGGKVIQSGFQKGDDSSVVTDYMKDEGGKSGPTVGANSKTVDVTGYSGDSGGGGSGPPKSRTISLTPQVIKPSTNGIVSNGEVSANSKAGSWQDSLHHVNSTDANAKEDSSVSEDLSNSEENTDDFFNFRGESNNKADYSYEEDFHSDNSKSETKSKSQVGPLHSKYEETEDCTVSESSFGTEVDYMEPIRS